MKKTKLAPVIIFAYNRLIPLKEMVDSLQKNTESHLTKVFIFIDGPKKESDVFSVNEVKDYVKNIKGFKSLDISISSMNNGLSNSIISGVSQVFEHYDKAIILEDDLILSANFLSYMNASLNYYQNFEKVISVSGYSNKISSHENYNFDSYFITRNSSWGWATWKNQWCKIDWELDDWEMVKSNSRDFNNYCGSDCFKMLEKWKNGLNQSWAIRFVYSQYLQKKFSVTPLKSKVINAGFSGDGTHCAGKSRFVSEFDNSNNKTFYFPERILINEQINKQAIKYHSLYYRIYMKIKNFSFEK